MQATATLRDNSIRLDEPVRSLLRRKDSHLWSISADATVYEAIQMMSDKHIGCLLVLSGGRLAGIVTERDYARKIVLQGRASHQTHVRDIMSKPVLFVRMEDTLDHAMRLMTTRRIRHLPVFDNEQLVGIVSIGDLVRWMVDAQQWTIRHLQDYIEGTYPGQQPRHFYP
jgi:CBS domain-containing protein